MNYFKIVVLFIIVTVSVLGQCTLPKDAYFLGATTGNSIFPTFGYARLITCATGGLYSFTQNILTSVSVKPLQVTNHTDSGFLGNLKEVPELRLSFWYFFAPGVAQSATNTGFSWNYGGLAIQQPVKKWPKFKIAGGYKVVDSTISKTDKSAFFTLVLTGN